MPTPALILRFRRRRAAAAQPGRALARAGAAAAAIVALVLGAGGLLGAALYGSLTSGLPPTEGIEAAFDSAQGGIFRASEIYDRSGAILLLQVLNPNARERVAVRLNPGEPGSAPTYLVHALLAAHDPGFWDNPGYDPDWLALALLVALRGGSAPDRSSITQALVRVALTPPDFDSRSTAVQDLREALLASELTRAFSKDQILTWYLNSADFGARAFGADAAALVYFGKHVGQLSIAEAAWLAGRALDPALDPWRDTHGAQDRQVEVLEAMVEEGYLTATDAASARLQPIRLQPPAPESASSLAQFGEAALQRLAQRYGAAFAGRGGLRVITSLDADLQLQVECLLRTQLERLSGGEAGATIPALDGSACVAAGLLPPLRPGDAGVDHEVGAAAAVVIDPATGEVLSMVGEGEVGPGSAPPAEELHPLGSAFFPFIYLSAFAGGSTPASMVLDIPTAFPRTEGRAAYTPVNDDGIYHGPVRMRIALASSFNVAAVRTLNDLGAARVLRTARQMGLALAGDREADFEAELALEARASPLDTAFAYSVMAAGGVMTGEAAPDSISPSGTRTLEPIMILRVLDAEGRVVLEPETGSRAVLSPQLAYLVDSVLSDETARQAGFGSAGPLDLGRPAAVKTGTTPDRAHNWTVGFTPSRSVAIWLGGREGEPMRSISALNGAAPIWQALTRYSLRDQPPEGWLMPAGVGLLEVCDPSGALPTAYCPNIVREVFIQGTEPVHPDPLFQPFRVNRETGKLATLFTPLDLVEERVYLIPPPEAESWARQAGLELPPNEYDTIVPQPPNPAVNLTSPSWFELARGEIEIRGRVDPEGLDYFRLQVGEGLNPDQWLQLGEDVRRPVQDGLLGRWDSGDSSGLFTIQLLAVLLDGRVLTAAVPVTIDNQAPTLRMISPLPEERFDLASVGEVVFQAEVSDDHELERIEFVVDNRVVRTVSAPPYSTRWALRSAGQHVVFARAYDAAGNRAESERITFSVER